jgi:2-methylcitrate dehydratase PrpD
MSQTHTLAAYLVSNRWADIPDDVRHEARRSLLNYMGCAIGGSPHPAMDLAIRALSPFSGERTASVLGRSERLRCTRR